MKIAIAQIESKRGDVKSNLRTHLHAIDVAGQYAADLILFPELSLSGYFPKIAARFLSQVQHDDFNIFQKKSDLLSMSIALGSPIQGIQKPKIGLHYFTPGQLKTSYAKQILHEDELSDFEAGEGSQIWHIKEHLISPAICYESMQNAHNQICLLYTSPSPRDQRGPRMPSSA